MKEKDGEHPFGDAGQLILLGLFLVVWVGDSFFLHISTLPSDYVPPTVRVLSLGLALAIAVPLFRSGHAAAHARGRDGLVTTGAFRYVRHPLYLASILFYFGLAVATLSLSALALLPVIVIFYDYIAGYEEKLLVMRFGEQYSRYRKRTGKWVPRISMRG